MGRTGLVSDNTSLPVGGQLPQFQNAVVREREIIGEAAGRVTRTVAAAHPEIPWKAMTGIRHKLIHDYFEVDPSVVWTTATVNVPEVLPLVRQALADLVEGDG